MKLIVAGGRGYYLTVDDYAYLDRVRSLLASGSYTIDEVLSSGNPGADAGAEEWARSRKVPVKRFVADWSRGLLARPILYRAMARYAALSGLCILFPGGRGTDSMRCAAIGAGLQVLEVDLDRELESLPPLPCAGRSSA
jgi:hypothetical protein